MQYLKSYLKSFIVWLGCNNVISERAASKLIQEFNLRDI